MAVSSHALRARNRYGHGEETGKSPRMSEEKATRLTVAVGETIRVSALLLAPESARACYVLAHGAGVGMAHPFMGAMASGLAERGIATFRYQFPYMEQGGKRPDPPRIAQATVRAAVEEAAHRLPRTPLIAGGKSFGGRMTSGAQAAAPLRNVRGIALLGFPLHAPGQPSDERAAHLFEVKIPMLFLQGTRDELADLSLLQPLCAKLGPKATLVTFDDADHSFHVPARSGRSNADVRRELLDAFVSWIDTVI
jgi:predicted alpha/beta-hydrolase family hydrolase